MKNKHFLWLALGVSVFFFILSEFLHTTWAGYIGLLGFFCTAIVLIVLFGSLNLSGKGQYSWVVPGLLSLVISYAWYVLAEPLLLLALHSSPDYGVTAFAGDVQARLGQMLLPAIITTVVVFILVRYFKSHRGPNTRINNA